MEKELKELGFKKKWLSDMSGHWFRKNFKGEDFKFRIEVDTESRHCHLSIKTFSHVTCEGKCEDPQYEVVKRIPYNITKIKEIINKYSK